MKKILIGFVRLYQRAVSPFLGTNCLYSPTCSQYAVETLEEKPVWIAIPKITARVASCNPINGFIKYKKASDI